MAIGRAQATMRGRRTRPRPNAPRHLQALYTRAAMGMHAALTVQ